MKSDYTHKDKKTSSTRQKITALIYNKRGRLLSVGKNSYHKSHPTQAKYALKVGQPYKQFLHAEIAALIKCRGVPYKIYVERKDAKGNSRLAKPCPICELAIKEAGIKYVEYSI